MHVPAQPSCTTVSVDEPMCAYETELKNFSIEDIAESGQCFRIFASDGKSRIDKKSRENVFMGGASPEKGLMDKIPHENTFPDKVTLEYGLMDTASYENVPADTGSFVVIAYGRVLNVAHKGSLYTFSCSKDAFQRFWRRYFDLDSDYEKYKKMVLPHDEYLSRAIRFGSGIRILNQDPWEVLVSFIISQRKSVPAIRTSVEKLSRALGENIDGVHFSFPEAQTIVNTDDEILASCGLGYRLPYVKDAARAVLHKDPDLEAIGKLKTAELVGRLMELKGVGIKVASCVALFGYHHLDALPVDVWMKRVIDTRYDGYFPDEYLSCAGVLQQYMYNYARLNKTET